MQTLYPGAQQTFALVHDTTVYLNYISTNTFVQGDIFTKIETDENNNKRFIRAIYSGTSWLPTQNAVLNYGEGYIAKISNGFSLNVTGTNAKQTTISISPNAQVTFSITQETLDLNLLDHAFTKNDIFTSIGVDENGNKQFIRAIYSGNSWLPTQNAILKSGIGYIVKINNGINKIVTL